MSILSRPAELNRRARVDTVDDADAALHEMAWLIHQRTTINAAAQKRIDAIKAEAQASLVVDINGLKVTVQERLELLDTNLRAWMAEHLDEVLVGKAKSKELAHGVIGTRKDRDIVDCDEDEVLAAIEACLLNTSSATIEELRERIYRSEVNGFILGSLVNISVTIDKQGIKKLWDNLASRRPDLGLLGIQLKTGEKKLVVEPAQYVVTNEDPA